MRFRESVGSGRALCIRYIESLEGVIAGHTPTTAEQKLSFHLMMEMCTGFMTRIWIEDIN
jgi:hypothetical protein